MIQINDKSWYKLTIKVDIKPIFRENEKTNGRMTHSYSLSQQRRWLSLESRIRQLISSVWTVEGVHSAPLTFVFVP